MKSTILLNGCLVIYFFLSSECYLVKNLHEYKIGKVKFYKPYIRVSFQSSYENLLKFFPFLHAFHNVKRYLGVIH